MQLLASLIPFDLTPDWNTIAERAAAIALILVLVPAYRQRVATIANPWGTR